jgi:predicted helicase
MKNGLNLTSIRPRQPKIREKDDHLSTRPIFDCLQSLRSGKNDLISKLMSRKALRLANILLTHMQKQLKKQVKSL